jgi:hypothetical protein
MVTLTYRHGELPSDRDVSGFLDRVGKWVGRRSLRPLRSIWRYEFGELRGRGHYHVLLWLPKGLTLPKPDKRGWWAAGSTRTERVRSAARYIASYASKGAAAPNPDFDVKGLRWWGCGGMTRAGRSRLRLLVAPRWVFDQAMRLVVAFGDAVTVRRSVRSGWWEIGAFVFRSPWRFVGSGADGSVVLAPREYDDACWGVA